jgi:hypothetical protein
MVTHEGAAMDVNSYPRYPTGRGDGSTRDPLSDRYGWEFAGGALVAVVLIALFLWLCFLALFFLFGPPVFAFG